MTLQNFESVGSIASISLVVNDSPIKREQSNNRLILLGRSMNPQQPLPSIEKTPVHYTEGMEIPMNWIEPIHSTCGTAGTAIIKKGRRSCAGKVTAAEPCSFGGREILFPTGIRTMNASRVLSLAQHKAIDASWSGGCGRQSGCVSTGPQQQDSHHPYSGKPHLLTPLMDHKTCLGRKPNRNDCGM